MKGIKKLIIFGDGPTAEVVFDIVSEYKLFEVECFTVDKKYNKKKFIKKKKIISYEIIKKIKKKEEYVLFVSLGYSNMNKNRETIYKRAINDGFKLTNIIHPKAVIPKKTKVGKNCFIKKKHKNDFNRSINVDQTLEIPVAHNEGNFYCNNDNLKYLHDNELIAFEYCGGRFSNTEVNINGSIDNIAGITNKNKNILGMMPHPERAFQDFHKSQDGKLILDSILT